MNISRPIPVKKRPLSSEAGISEITRRLNAGRDRCAAAKRAADEKTQHDAAALAKLSPDGYSPTS
jgi:hypothetical protein